MARQIQFDALTDEMQGEVLGLIDRSEVIAKMVEHELNKLLEINLT